MGNGTWTGVGYRREASTKRAGMGNVNNMKGKYAGIFLSLKQRRKG